MLPLPSVETLLTFTKRTIAPALTLLMHNYLCKCGLEAHTSLGNHFISIFSECAIVECAPSDHDFSLYRRMREDLSDYGRHLVALIKACARIKDVERGCKLHSEIAGQGMLDIDPFVGTALVNMYAKFGMFDEAWDVFNNVTVQDVVLWTTLIAGYTQHDHAEEALNCFEQMQHQGVCPNAFTFACSLKACASIGARDKGRELHSDIERRGLLESSHVMGTALIDVYGKCDMIVHAEYVFDKLAFRDVISWTALIAGYVEQDYGEEALICFEQMESESIFPSVATFSCSLKACGIIRASDKGGEIHAEVARKGLVNSNPIVGTALVDMYARCGILSKAEEVFEKLPVHDIMSWTALIAGYMEHGKDEEALKCLEQMQSDGICPDASMITCILKACGNIGALDAGIELHMEIARREFLKTDKVVGNALVDMYVKCGSLAKAQEVFDTIPVKNVVAWTTLIAGYADHMHEEEALYYFERMHLEGVSPDAVAYVCILKACGSIGAVERGRILHADVEQRGVFWSSQIVGNALIDMYTKFGMLLKAQEVFDKIQVRDVVSWNMLITGYAQLGEMLEVEDLFDRMIKEVIFPNAITFAGILNACVHTGQIDKGLTCFKAMCDYGIVPTIEHHNCMVDLLGRAGQLDKAVAILKRASPDLDIAMWCTFLSACRKCGDVELGRQAFEQALHSNEKDAAVYICIFNIYADT